MARNWKQNKNDRQNHNNDLILISKELRSIATIDPNKISNCTSIQVRELLRKSIYKLKKYLSCLPHSDHPGDPLIEAINSQLTSTLGVRGERNSSETTWLQTKLGFTDHEISSLPSDTGGFAFDSVRNFLNEVDTLRNSLHQRDVRLGSLPSYLEAIRMITAGISLIFEDGLKYYQRDNSNFSTNSIKYGAYLFVTGVNNYTSI